MKKLILFSSILLLCITIKANNPSIITLSEYINNSEHILVGTVISKVAIDTTQERQCKEKSWIGCEPILYQAKINVLREFKGYVKTDMISFEFYFGPNCYCNSFNPNDTIIVFLNGSNKNYQIYNYCIFGDKTLTTKGIIEYLSRINDYPNPLLKSDPVVYNKLITEWYVKCAEGYYTSWEGMFKIGDYSNPVTLTESQMHRLKKALIGFKTFELRHTELLNYVVRHDNSPELKKYILNNLKQLNKSNYYIKAYELMSAYSKLDKRESLNQLFHQYLKSGYSKNLANGYAIVLAYIQTIEVPQ